MTNSIQLTDLPEEVLIVLFRYLSHKDILQLSKVCRSLHRLCKEDVIWKSTFRGPHQHLLRLHHSLVKEKHPKTPTWKYISLLANSGFDATNGGPLEILPTNPTMRIRGRYSEMLFAKYGEIVDNNQNENVSQSCTVELWFQTDSTCGKDAAGIILGGQSESVASKIWPQYHWQLLHIGPDGHIRGAILTYCMLKGPYVADGNWHHVAISGDSQVQKLYLDGLEVDHSEQGFGSQFHQKELRYSQLGTGCISYGYNTPYGTDAMARGHCGPLAFKGRLKDLRIWDKACSASEIAQRRHIARLDLYLKEQDPNEFKHLLYLWPLSKLCEPGRPLKKPSGSKCDYELKPVHPISINEGITFD